MIDQTLVSIPTNPPVASYREQSRQEAAADDGQDFKSYVDQDQPQRTRNQPVNDGKPASNAGAQHQASQDAAAIGKQDAIDEAGPQSILEPAPKSLLEPATKSLLEPIQKSTLDTIEARLRLASLKQVQKSTSSTPEIVLSPDSLKQNAKAKQLVISAAELEAKTKEKLAKPELAEKNASEELGELLGLKKRVKQDLDADVQGENSAELAMSATAAADGTSDPKAQAPLSHLAKASGIDDLAQAIGVDLKSSAGKDIHDKNRAVDDRKADDGIVRVAPAAVRSRPDDETVVRVVSADGKAKPLDIALPKQTTEAAGDVERRVSAPKVETVTVVEARRYLGMADGSNAANLATAVKGDQTWSQALSRAAPVETRLAGDTITEVNTLKLQMNPENLGNMVASLKLKGEELSVEVRVESVEAYRQLSADQDGIVKALQDQGFSIDQVSVQLSPAAAADAGGDLDGQPRQNPSTNEEQRQARERDPERRSNNQDAWQNNDDTAKPSVADARSDMLRDGNFYL